MENTAMFGAVSVSTATVSEANVRLTPRASELVAPNRSAWPAHPIIESGIVSDGKAPITGEPCNRRRRRRAIERAAIFDANDGLPLEHRLRIIALHVPWYGFRTQSRLAKDSGISRAAVSRLVRHRSQPSLWVALRLTRALSVRLGRPLDVWEVFSLDGTYPTASVCELCGCRSCSLGPKPTMKDKPSVQDKKGGA